MESSLIKHLKEPEAENSKLKCMYANLVFDNEVLRYVIEKNFRARGKKEIVYYLAFEDDFWKIYTRIRKAEHKWNCKKVYKVYKHIHCQVIEVWSTQHHR